MTVRSNTQVLRAIAAAAFVAVLLVLAPSAAQAHPGHSHAHPATQQQSKAAVSKSTAAKSTVNRSTVAKPAANQPRNTTHELKAASGQQPTMPADGCNRGCCDFGPCNGGCHGFVLAALPDTIPPLISRLLTLGNAPPHPVPHVYRLRRPPKSFA